MRRLVEKVRKVAIRSDAMNEPFKKHRQAERFFLAWALFGAVFMLVGILKLAVTLPDPIRWHVIVTLGSIIFLMNLCSYIDRKVDALRRELWFIKHRLGLPLDPEELEDVEAYEKWLEERLREG